ncbi:hypothetical protein ACP275_04G091500 [Erythranthe tilingii]
MKSHFRTMAALFLTLTLLILDFHVQESLAMRPLIANAPITSPKIVHSFSSQSLKNLQERERRRYERMNSSARKVPPSRSNPTQNK